MDLNQKVIVVTGAGRGLAAVATYFAGKGARIACVDLNQKTWRHRGR